MTVWNKEKTFFRNLIYVAILEAIDEKNRIRSRIRNPLYGSKDPDQSQNVMDQEHWIR